MTSPDGAGLPEPGGPVGQWDMLINLGALGQSIIMRPLAELLSKLTGQPPENWDTLPEILTGLAGVLDLSGLLGMIQDHAEQIGDLQDKTQILEGVIGHCSTYMTASPGTTTSPQRMPFTTQIGPRVGAEIVGDGSIRLLSRGLWDIYAQVEFYGGVGMPPGTYLDIIVRNPSGGAFYRMKAKASSRENITVTNITSVTVPAANYTVEVQAWTDDIPLLGTFRGIRGGIETTRLNVRKISNEVN